MKLKSSQLVVACTFNLWHSGRQKKVDLSELRTSPVYRRVPGQINPVSGNTHTHTQPPPPKKSRVKSIVIVFNAIHLKKYHSPIQSVLNKINCGFFFHTTPGLPTHPPGKGLRAHPRILEALIEACRWILIQETANSPYWPLGYHVRPSHQDLRTPPIIKLPQPGLASPPALMRPWAMASAMRPAPTKPMRRGSDIVAAIRL